MSQIPNIIQSFQDIVRSLPVSMINENEQNSIINMLNSFIGSNDPLATIVNTMQSSNAAQSDASLITNITGTLMGSMFIAKSSLSSPSQGEISNAIDKLGRMTQDKGTNFKQLISPLQNIEIERTEKLPEFNVRDVFKSAGISPSRIDALFGRFDSSGIDLNNSMKNMINALGIGNAMSETIIRLAMSNNNIHMMRNILDNGLNPNMKIGNRLSLVNLCKSEEMLNLMMEHGLNLELNMPLLRIPYDVFISMIEKHGADPFCGYEHQTNREKLTYINPLISEVRKGSKKHLNKTPLPTDLIQLIIDYIIPRVKAI